MKRKNHPETQPRPPAPSATSTVAVIDLEADTQQQNPLETQSEPSLKRSWVLNHLKVSSDPAFVICQVITKAGTICGKQSRKDKSGSTKNLYSHLAQIHSLANPHLTKKTKMSHMDIEKWSKTGISKPKVSQNCPLSLSIPWIKIQC